MGGKRHKSQCLATFQVNKVMWEVFKECARQEGVPVSYLLRTLMKKEIQNRGLEIPKNRYSM
jgi:hypothetical protein